MTYRHPRSRANVTIPGCSARAVESPITATTGELGDRGGDQEHQLNGPTVRESATQSPGSLVSFTERASAEPESIVVARTANSATSTSATGAATAIRRTDAPSHGARPRRIGCSTR